MRRCGRKDPVQICLTGPLEFDGCTMMFAGDELPASVKCYKRTPQFTERTLPPALTRAHSTKPGVWGVIHIVSGKLRYVVPSTGLDVILDEQRHGVITPRQLHYVEPIGEVRVFIEFWN